MHFAEGISYSGRLTLTPKPKATFPRAKVSNSTLISSSTPNPIYYFNHGQSGKLEVKIADQTHLLHQSPIQSMEMEPMKGHTEFIS